jgi:hypothetical protein
MTYPSEEGSHPLAGHRAPDLQLDRRVGVRQLWELLRDGHFALLTRRDRRRHPQIDHPGVTAAVVLEEDAAQWGSVDTALVRPDGYFAWLGGSTRPQLRVRAGSERFLHRPAPRVTSCTQ